MVAVLDQLADLEVRLFNQAARVYGVRESCLTAEQVLGAAASDGSAAEALNVSASIETLFSSEVEASRELLEELSARGGLDSISAWVQTTTTKRVLYLMSPIILRDPLAATWFPRVGSNSRVQLFQADPIERSVRLEAISTFARDNSRFRYALSIQYVRDACDVPWQVIRPVILIDPWIIDTIATRGDRAAELLVDSLRLLGVMVSQGSHDYLHGTMMRWFRPPAFDCPPAYRAMMVERPAPPEMRRWEESAVGRVSGPIAREIAIPISDPLEYWSLAVHATSVARMAEREPARLDALHEVQERYTEGLVEIASLDPRPDVRTSAEMLCAVSAFFLALVSPRADHTPRVLRQSRPPLDWSVIAEFVTGAHHGLARVVSSLDRTEFVWGGARTGIYDVLRVYMRDMQCLYDRLTASHGEDELTGLRYDLYEELARRHRVA